MRAAVKRLINFYAVDQSKGGNPAMTVMGVAIGSFGNDGGRHCWLVSDYN